MPQQTQSDEEIRFIEEEKGGIRKNAVRHNNRTKAISLAAMSISLAAIIISLWDQPLILWAIVFGVIILGFIIIFRYVGRN